MATIVKQWNVLPGRAGESLYVCYSWPGLLGLAPLDSVGEPNRGLAFFRPQDSANLAQEIPTCSCCLQEIQYDLSKIAGGWRVVLRKRKESVSESMFHWNKIYKGKASNGICVFRLEHVG